MAREILDRRTEQITITKETLIEVESLPEGDVIYKNNMAIAGDDPSVYAAYARMILQQDFSNKTVAVIGGGTLIFPRMISRGTLLLCDIFELEESIMNWAINKYPLALRFRTKIGDYRQRIEESYDYIIFDIEESLFDEALLLQHLKPGGKIILPHRLDGGIIENP